VVDRHGNGIAYGYRPRTGNSRPYLDVITYTTFKDSSGPHKVTFLYENRPGPDAALASSIYAVATPLRLARVEVTAAGTPFATYFFDYTEPSNLAGSMLRAITRARRPNTIPANRTTLGTFEYGASRSKPLVLEWPVGATDGSGRSWTNVGSNGAQSLCFAESKSPSRSAGTIVCYEPAEIPAQVKITRSYNSDTGFFQGRMFVDWNNDGWIDYCRFAHDMGTPLLECSPNEGGKFTGTVAASEWSNLTL
jgi:hypothetical protein